MRKFEETIQSLILTKVKFSAAIFGELEKAHQRGGKTEGDKYVQDPLCILAHFTNTSGEIY